MYENISVSPTGLIPYHLVEYFGSSDNEIPHMLFHTESWVYLLDFFCSGIQFYVLLSPHFCFISFLYLDLYDLGADAWIS